MKVCYFKGGRYTMCVVETSKGVRIPLYQSSGKNGIAGEWLPFAGYNTRTNPIIKNSGHGPLELIKGILMKDGTKTFFYQNQWHGAEYRVFKNRVRCGNISVERVSRHVKTDFNPSKIISFTSTHTMEYGANEIIRTLMKEGLPSSC